MSSAPAPPSRVIWATRGRSWGFRFLLDGGFADPLPEYERAFAGLAEELNVWHREPDCVALRFSDPIGRRDRAGRTIPHEFVILGDRANTIVSLASGIEQVWPVVEATYATIWEREAPPAAGELRVEA